MQSSLLRIRYIFRDVLKFYFSFSDTRSFFHITWKVFFKIIRRTWWNYLQLQLPSDIQLTLHERRVADAIFANRSRIKIPANIAKYMRRTKEVLWIYILPTPKSCYSYPWHQLLNIPARVGGYTAVTLYQCGMHIHNTVNHPSRRHCKCIGGSRCDCSIIREIVMWLFCGQHTRPTIHLNTQ